MADLVLSGVVGYDIIPKEVKHFLESTSDEEVTVYLNSPGGAVWDGLEIYNLLRASGKRVKTVLTGLAASMGSIIFLAGDERIAMTGTLYMVHKPSALTWGNADEMKKTIEMLDKAQDSLAMIYKERAGIQDIHDYINAETWFTTQDMQELGITNSAKEVRMENLLREGESLEMAKIDDLKVEKEKLETEKAELEEKIAEAKLTKEVADMQAEVEKLRAEASEPDSELEAEEEELQAGNDDEEDGNEEADLELEEDEESESDSEPAAKANIINTKKAIAKNIKNKIPAFMQMDSKY